METFTMDGLPARVLHITKAPLSGTYSEPRRL